MSAETRCWLMGSVSMDAIRAMLKLEEAKDEQKYQKIIED